MMNNNKLKPNTKIIKKPRAEKTEETKKHIYNVGRDLLRKYGYNNVTIKMIADESGVSIGSFYHFFGSKDEFFSQISMSVNTAFLWPEDINYEADDCKFRIVTFYKQFCEMMSTRDLDMLGDTFFRNHGNKTLLQNDRNYRKYLLKMLNGFQQAGKLCRDITVSEIEDCLMICLMGLIYHWVTCDCNYPLYPKLQIVIGNMIDHYISK